jgi:hypothetical protein
VRGGETALVGGGLVGFTNCAVGIEVAGDPGIGNEPGRSEMIERRFVVLGTDRKSCARAMSTSSGRKCSISEVSTSPP